MSSTGKQRGGRPSKGPRKQRMFRYPYPLDAALAAAAEDGGNEDVQDLMIEILTEEMRQRGYLPTEDQETGHLISA